MVGRFLSQLHEQRAFLEAFATSYDDGNESEAKRLAVTVRVLVYDHRRNVSLLTHLGVKDQLGYVDTAIGVPPPGALILHAGLCMCAVTLGAPGAPRELRYKPVLSDLSPDREHPPTSFVDWWETPIVSDQDGNEYTRGSIVLSVANQDGARTLTRSSTPRTSRFSRGTRSGWARATRSNTRTAWLSGPFGRLRTSFSDRSTDCARIQQHPR